MTRLHGAEIHVEPGALDRVGSLVVAAAPAHRYVLVSDDNVAPRYAGRVTSSLPAGRTLTLTIPPGERHKTRESWATITDRMLVHGCGRDTTILALGGGVVGDLAGFVAATFMRGVPFVQLPTTLLAMIDASIGGKTGVDTPAGKNLVGAFHQPRLVVVDPTVLATLPAPELRAGLAEAVKHGAIADERYFETIGDDIDALLAPGGATGDEMLALVRRSIEIKADVVSRDEREAGLRKILNFGHTLGHAIEAASDYTLLHGEAVAVGMALESEAAELAGIAECDTSRRVVEVLERAGLPVRRPASLDAATLLRATHGDKKARAGAAEYALPRRIGAMAGESTGWSVPLDDEVVLQVLA